MLKAFSGLALVTLALFPGEARAAKIRVPADQATIQAAVDAAGSGDEIVISAGTYTENVLVGSKTNLTIKAKGSAVVIIDAGGTGYPLSITNSTDVTVKKVRVQNTGDSHGIRVSSSSSVVLTACRARTYSGSGISVDNSSAVELLKCRITGVGGDNGITLDTSDGCLIEACRVDGASSDGINVSGFMNVIRKNKVTDAGVHGIRLGDLSATQATLVIENVVKNSGLDGIFCGADADGCSLFENTISGCSDGIDLDTGSNSHVVADNTIKSPRNSGIETSSDDHTILDNSVKKSTDQAYYVLALAGGCLLQGNSSKKSASDGFYAGGTGNTFQHNTGKKSAGFDLNDPNPDGSNHYVGNKFGTIAP